MLGTIAVAAISGLPSRACAQSQAEVNDANQQTYFNSASLQRGRTSQPQYGTPPASGAGTTGFDSTNARKKKKARVAAGPQAATLVTPSAYLRPQLRTAGSVATPISTVPTAPRIYAEGGGTETAGQLARIVQARRVPVAAVDPFDPLGVRVGTFIVKPAVEMTAGHDTNVPRSTTSKASSFLLMAPELLAKSDWSRHELSANLRGSYVAYNELPSYNRPNFDSKVNARIDVTSQTRVDLEGRALFSTDAPGDPNFPKGVSEPPRYSTLGMTAGIARRFNRLELSVKGVADRTEYEEATLNDGTTLDNSDLNYKQYATALRGSYEINPGVKPFVEVAFDKRQHDNPIDAAGIARDSTGMTPRVGTTFELSRQLTGEVSVGYLTRHYQDPSLQDLQGTVFDASLLWNANALTKFGLTAKTTADESRSAGISGILRRDVGLQVDHAFRQWLILTGKLNAGLDDFQGSDREDKRYGVSGILTYKMNRNFWLKGEVRQEWFTSNAPDSNYNATTFLLGLRFQQ